MTAHRAGTALVTGGSSGLGLATAALLKNRWREVVVVDLPREGAREAAESIGAVFAPADITNPEELTAAVAIATSAGPLRAVVHCAGRGGPLRILDKEGKPGSVAHFSEVVRVNLVGSFTVLGVSAAAMALNDLEDGERGAIVLTASIAAFEGQIGQAPYAASKAGVHGLTIVAARDLASRGIRVNTIAPGTFDTPMLKTLSDDVRAALAAAVPQPHRLGEPAEFAALADHLLQNHYINGETIRLDGAIRMPPR